MPKNDKVPLSAVLPPDAEGLIHAQNCILQANAKSAHPMDVRALHELDQLIDQITAEARR